MHDHEKGQAVFCLPFLYFSPPLPDGFFLPASAAFTWAVMSKVFGIANCLLSRLLLDMISSIGEAR